VKKILVLTESIDLNDSSGAKANLALINNLNYLGFDLYVYHYTRKNLTLDGIKCYPIKEHKLNGFYFFAKLIVLLNRFFKIKFNLFFENKRGFSFTNEYDKISMIKALNKVTIEPDLVLTLSKAASFRPHRALLHFPKWHNKWLAYIHDPYPFHCYPRPYDWIGPGDKQKMQFMQQVFDKASFIGFPSQLLSEWMYSYYPAKKNKIKIIPHQIDNNLKADKENLPKDFKISDINLVHAGALLGHRPPTALLIAFKRLLKQKSIPENTVLWLVGGGLDNFSSQINEFKKAFPNNLRTLNQVKFNVAFAMQYFANFNIVIESDSYLSPFLPGKLSHLIKANKPIIHIGPKLSEVNRLLSKEKLFLSLTHAEIKDVNDHLSNFINIKKEFYTNDTIEFSENLVRYFSFNNLKKLIQID
jgi:hypothetical protein